MLEWLTFIWHSLVGSAAVILAGGSLYTAWMMRAQYKLTIQSHQKNIAHNDRMHQLSKATYQANLEHNQELLAQTASATREKKFWELCYHLDDAVQAGWRMGEEDSHLLQFAYVQWIYGHVYTLQRAIMEFVLWHYSKSLDDFRRYELGLESIRIAFQALREQTNIRAEMESTILQHSLADEAEYIVDYIYKVIKKDTQEGVQNAYLWFLINLKDADVIKEALYEQYNQLE